MRKFLYNNPLQLEPIPSFRYFGQLRRSSDGFLEFRSEVYGWRAAVLYALRQMSFSVTVQHFVSYFTPKHDKPRFDLEFYNDYRYRLSKFYVNYHRIFSVLHHESLPWNIQCDNHSLDVFQLKRFDELSYNGIFALDLVIVVLNQLLVWRCNTLGLSDSDLLELKRFFSQHSKYYILKDVYSDLFTSSKDLFD